MQSTAEVPDALPMYLQLSVPSDDTLSFTCLSDESFAVAWKYDSNTGLGRPETISSHSLDLT